jgi:hypothetical protein
MCLTNDYNKKIKVSNIRYLIVASATLVTLIQQPIFAQTMPKTTEGYFWSGKTAYAKTGGLICSFANRSHFDIYRQIRPAGDVVVQDITSFKYLGTCPLPESIFYNDKGTGFYSFGDGRICGLPSAAVRDTYKSRYAPPELGKTGAPIPPFKWVGDCPKP